MKKYLTTLIVFLSTVLAVNYSHSAEGKFEEVFSQPIPDKSAAGSIQGREFKLDEAILTKGILELRQEKPGEGGSIYVEQFRIDLSVANDDVLQGKKITIKPNQKSDVSILLKYREGQTDQTKDQKGYALNLEFGTAKNGKLPGKIHLRLSDEAGSFVVGSFKAVIKKP